MNQSANDADATTVAIISRPNITNNFIFHLRLCNTMSRNRSVGQQSDCPNESKCGSISDFEAHLCLLLSCSACRHRREKGCQREAISCNSGGAQRRLDSNSLQIAQHHRKAGPAITPCPGDEGIHPSSHVTVSINHKEWRVCSKCDAGNSSPQTPIRRHFHSFPRTD